MALEIPPANLERYRAYLHLLARLHMPGKLRGKLDASDVVQQALLQVHQAWAGFRGTGEAQVLTWLRQILAHTLTHAQRDFSREKREVARERSLEAALEASSLRLGNWLAADQASPSEQADRNEQAMRLAEALAELPEAQREALVLHYWQDWSVAAIGEHLGRTPAAIAGLLKRGLRQLRQQLRTGDDI